jgi:hypothetical protein
MEKVTGGAERTHQPLHIVEIIVKIEASPHSCGNAERLVKRLSTVMTGSNRDTFAVENSGDVVRMDVAHTEAHDSIGAVERLNALDTIDLFESLPGRV